MFTIKDVIVIKSALILINIENLFNLKDQQNYIIKSEIIILKIYLYRER